MFKSREILEKVNVFAMEYCGIIRIRGGSIFVELVGTPHPRIYILNEIISKMFIEHFNEKGMVCNTTYII